MRVLGDGCGVWGVSGGFRGWLRSVGCHGPVGSGLCVGFGDTWRATSAHPLCLENVLKNTKKTQAKPKKKKKKKRVNLLV